MQQTMSGNDVRRNVHMECRTRLRLPVSQACIRMSESTQSHSPTWGGSDFEFSCLISPPAECQLLSVAKEVGSREMKKGYVIN